MKLYNYLTESYNDFFDATDDLLVAQDFVDYEEAWAGGVADLGDSAAAEHIQYLPGYHEYIKEIRNLAKKHLGSNIKVFRAVTEEGYEDWKAGADIGYIAVTLKKDVAKKWGNLAINKNKKFRVLTFNIKPLNIIMRGKSAEAELVIDGNEVSFHTVKETR